MYKTNEILTDIRIQNNDFDISIETKKISSTMPGAIVNFIGIVRDNDYINKKILSLTLEHYPGMTEKEIQNIIKDCHKKWNITAVTVIHRIGKLFPSDQIVFVGVGSKHRQNAFNACNYIMDWLKTKAPFWKIEETSSDKVWVKHKTTDDDAIKKWIC